MPLGTSGAPVEQRVQQLDLSLWDAIPSQTTPGDRRSLLALQAAAAARLGRYSYLEIGSYVGGSIQPHLLDDRCTHICSIDARPAIQPDQRGQPCYYENNSTARMMSNLRGICPEGLGKIQTIDGDTREIDTAQVLHRPDISLIDGEHTDVAVLGDFAFCRATSNPAAAIFFHDSNIIFQALTRIVQGLEAEGVSFFAYNLPDHVFVIELGGLALHEDPSILRMLVNNHVGYLAGLNSSNHYRDFFNKPIFRAIRGIKRKVTHSGLRCE